MAAFDPASLLKNLMPKEIQEMMSPENVAKLKNALKEFALEVDGIAYDVKDLKAQIAEITKSINAIKAELGIEDKSVDNMQK